MLQDLTKLKIDAISSEIQHQNNLIGQRTTLLVTSQAFLFGAFATLLNGFDSAQKAQRAIKLLRFAIPLVGLLIPILVLLAVVSAVVVIRRLREEHDLLCNKLADGGVEWLRCQPIHLVIFGQMLPVAASVGFLTAWIGVIVELRDVQ